MSPTFINEDGIWVLVNGTEYFIAFSLFPVFKQKPVEAVFKLQFFPPQHLRWDELDIDIELDSLENPGQFPLLFR